MMLFPFDVEVVVQTERAIAKWQQEQQRVEMGEQQNDDDQETDFGVLMKQQPEQAC